MINFFVLIRSSGLGFLNFFDFCKMKVIFGFQDEVQKKLYDECRIR